MLEHTGFLEDSRGVFCSPLPHPLSPPMATVSKGMSAGDMQLFP